MSSTSRKTVTQGTESTSTRVYGVLVSSVTCRSLTSSPTLPMSELILSPPVFSMAPYVLRSARKYAACKCWTICYCSDASANVALLLFIMFWMVLLGKRWKNSSPILQISAGVRLPSRATDFISVSFLPTWMPLGLSLCVRLQTSISLLSYPPTRPTR